MDGFEVYFVGLGGQLDVKVQGRKQSRLMSRFLQLGGWCMIYLGGNRDVKGTGTSQGFLDTLNVRCKIKGRNQGWGYTLKSGRACR